MKGKGFTLIELLIVVAIIAILAAIAVPNFLEARTRSMISRSQSDMRSIAVAIESYMVDHAQLPPDAATPATMTYAHYQLRRMEQEGTAQRPPAKFLTTPISYIAQVPWDAFGNKGIEDGIGKTPLPVSHAYAAKEYSFDSAHPLKPVSRPWNKFISGGLEHPFHDAIFPQPWFMWGIGPTYNYGMAAADPPNAAWVIPYDPTNGTISLGGIWRFASGSLF